MFIVQKEHKVCHCACASEIIYKYTSIFYCITLKNVVNMDLLFRSAILNIEETWSMIKNSDLDFLRTLLGKYKQDLIGKNAYVYTWYCFLKNSKASLLLKK